MKILLVDDKKESRETIAEMLEDALSGVQVFQAADGREAELRLEKFVATGELSDVVISDFRMPRVNGLELAVFMKGGSALRNIPIIIISTEPEVRAKAEVLGCKFLEKPFKIEELIALLPK